MWTFLWIALLLPLSVDNVWNISVGNYDLRFTYLAHLGIFVLIFSSILRKSDDAFGLIRNYLRERFVIAFGLVGLTGMIGTLFSENQMRSIFFSIWTVGTILSVPLAFRFLHLKLGSWIPRSLAFYLALQGGVILIDFILCRFGREQLSIGRINLASGCRPHAWYQEPNYFAGFALFGLLWMYQQFLVERDSSWKRVLLVCAAFTCAGIIFCTSRAGWLGLVGLVSLVFGRIAWCKLRQQDRFSRLSLSLGMAMICLAIGLQSKSILEFQSRFGSHGLRLNNLIATTDVFMSRPLFGAGPGAGGAYLLEHFPDHKYFKRTKYRSPVMREKLRNDPLSYSLFTELLSEWGGFGFLAFSVGIFYFLFTGISLPFGMALGWILFIVFASSQTLPRFDLWVAMSLISVLMPEAMKQKISRRRTEVKA